MRLFILIFALVLPASSFAAVTLEQMSGSWWIYRDVGCTGNYNSPARVDLSKNEAYDGWTATGWNYCQDRRSGVPCYWWTGGDNFQLWWIETQKPEGTLGYVGTVDSLDEITMREQHGEVDQNNCIKMIRFKH